MKFQAFAAGFRAMVPLWFGVIPFGLAYAVSARSAGLSLFDTQLMSVLVFAGSAQFSATGLFALQASSLSLVLTTFVINVRHLLYSLSLGQSIKLSWPQRFMAAHFLTDEAFGVVIAKGERSFAFLLGAELSLFIVWNFSTLIGGLLGQVIPDPEALGIDFIFPVAFIALLVPLLKTRLDVLVALLSGVLAWLGAQFLSSGLVILSVGVGGALLGAWLSKEQA